MSYQQAACDGDSQLTGTIEVPVAEVEAGKAADAGKAKAAGSPAKAKSSRAVSSRTSRTPGTDGRSRQRQACKDARVERDRKLDALGLNRTFEQLRALDDQVRVVCKDL